MTGFVVLLSRRAAVLGCAVIVLLSGAIQQPLSARSGPFARFQGNWSGNGIIRVKDQDNKLNAERIRCSAAYRQRGGYDVNLKLVCRSDSYNLDLTGQFSADGNNRVTGQWTEHTRNIGGGVAGSVRGSRLLVRADSPAFNANLSMITRGRRQSVRLKADGGGQGITASITLRRR